jgi:hypothetical protein
MPSPEEPPPDPAERLEGGEQPAAIPVIHAIERPYRVEIQLEGELKLSGELKGFSMIPSDEAGD